MTKNELIDFFDKNNNPEIVEILWEGHEKSEYYTCGPLRDEGCLLLIFAIDLDSMDHYGALQCFGEETLKRVSWIKLFKPKSHDSLLTKLCYACT